MNVNRIYRGPELGAHEASIGRVLLDRMERLASRPMIRERLPDAGTPEFSTIDWATGVDTIARIALALSDRGVVQGDRVAVLARNRSEMMFTELALMSIGALSVPIFANYPTPQIDYVLNHCGAEHLVVATAEQMDRVVEAPAYGRLREVFLVDGDAGAYRRTYPFSDLLSGDGRLDEFRQLVEPITPDDACLVMYTSGTTGAPKGVVLCHRNILSQQRALEQAWDVGPDDRLLSYLPWHHSFGGLFERFLSLYSGAPITIDDSYGRDLPRLIENFRAVQPTVYFSTPKIYQGLVTAAQHDPAVERDLFHPGLKFVFTAAAPLPGDLSAYFAERSVPVVEGWGLTETSPCCTLTPLESGRQPGSVGFPIAGVEVTIADDGEIKVRGPNVMLRYHDDPDRTAARIDPDGWLHTGDLGSYGPDGLAIGGRRDGVFKLTNGEKVPSQAVEMTVVGSSQYIEAAVACGRGRPSVVAVIVPSFPHLEAWARQSGVPTGDRATLLADARTRAMFRGELERINGLIQPKYAQLQGIVVVPRPLEIEHGELTPSTKVVRPRVIARFRSELDALHEAIETGAPAWGSSRYRIAGAVD